MTRDAILQKDFVRFFKNAVAAPKNVEVIRKPLVGFNVNFGVPVVVANKKNRRALLGEIKIIAAAQIQAFPPLRRVIRKSDFADHRSDFLQGKRDVEEKFHCRRFWMGIRGARFGRLYGVVLVFLFI